jgi:lipopolysaccharide heptosyltransferase I
VQPVTRWTRPLRVAIVRLTSLGDVVHTLPVAHALREHHPEAYIVWIAEEREQSLLHGNPAVDEVVTAPTRRWRHELRSPAGAVRVLREYRQIRRRLRSLHLDVAIDVQGFLKSSIFLRLVGAPVRIGFGWASARDPLTTFFTTDRVAPPSAARHIVDQNLCLLQPLGIAEGPVVFPLPAPALSLAEVRARLGALGLPADDRLVVLLPATRGPAKQWSPTAYRELALRLIARGSTSVLLLGGPGEESLLERIARGLTGAPIFALTPRPILDLMAFLGQAHLVIGNDTGPLHLAAALGVPSLGLFGPTNAARNGPYGRRTASIQSPTPRIEDIPVDAVFRAALEWLA